MLPLLAWTVATCFWASLEDDRVPQPLGVIFSAGGDGVRPPRSAMGVTHEAARARLKLGSALCGDGQDAAGRLKVDAARVALERLGAAPDAEGDPPVARGLSHRGCDERAVRSGPQGIVPRLRPHRQLRKDGVMHASSLEEHLALHIESYLNRDPNAPWPNTAAKGQRLYPEAVDVLLEVRTIVPR